MSEKQKQYLRQAEHHVAQGRSFKVMGECYSKLAELGDDAAPVHKAMAAACDKAANDHADQATWAMSCMKAIDAGGDDELDKIGVQPWPASVFPTTAAPPRAIPRVGQPSTPDPINLEHVPAEFRKLLVPEFPDEV